MAQCANCGAQAAEGAGFCPACGTPVVADTVPPVAGTAPPHWASSSASLGQPPYPGQQPPKKKGGCLKWGLIVVGIIFVLGTILRVVDGGDNATSPEVSIPTTQQTAPAAPVTTSAPASTPTTAGVSSGDNSDTGQNAVTAPSSTEVAFDPSKRLSWGLSELWYLDPVTPAQAQDLLDYLVTTMGLDKNSKDEKSFHISKQGDTYELRLVIKKGLETDQQTLNDFQLVSADMSQNVFGGAEVDIHLCDENLNTLRVVVG